MWEPFALEPVYKQILWGGDHIARRFGRKVPFNKVAESWEVTCREDGMSVVAGGSCRGMTLAEMMERYGERLLGSRSVARCGRGFFPLLIKFIDANDRLSVQVHPDDAYAHRMGEPNGKNEMWYVIDARPGAKLIFGLRPGVTKTDFARAVREGTVGDTLREVPVKPGDSFYIRAGTVHAILEGILIAEIQQNSNTTYRIYDWGRVGTDGRPRPLAVDRAMDVIDFAAGGKSAAFPARRETGATVRPLVDSPYFTTDEIRVEGAWAGRTDGGSFAALDVVDGTGTLRYDGGEMSLRAGQSLLLPACLGDYTVAGRLTVLDSRI